MHFTMSSILSRPPCGISIYLAAPYPIQRPSRDRQEISTPVSVLTRSSVMNRVAVALQDASQDCAVWDSISHFKIYWYTRDTQSIAIKARLERMTIYGSYNKIIFFYKSFILFLTWIQTH